VSSLSHSPCAHEYVYVSAQAAGFGNSSLGLSNATADEFYSELALFRESTYPGMMHGKEAGGGTWKDYIGFVDGRLRYVTVPTSLTMKQYRGIQERRKVINRVINFVDGQQPPLPPELGHLTYDGGWEFLWTYTFEALRASLFEGLAICFPVAFVVLLYSTENLLVALYAIVGIALIVASVLGTIEYIYGWDLGIFESLMGNLVVGFSVDYTIHLGHMFVAADKEHNLRHRVDRFSFAIRKMGGTVVGGAVTTLGAGLFMLPCQLVSFFKLGLLMVTTIFFSLLYAFGFVMPLLAAAGPSGDQFAFRPLSALKRVVFKVHGIIMGDE
jgi:predicted RND superfamily exporter protein